MNIFIICDYVYMVIVIVIYIVLIIMLFFNVIVYGVY